MIDKPVNQEKKINIHSAMYHKSPKECRIKSKEKKSKNTDKEVEALPCFCSFFLLVPLGKKQGFYQ